MATIRYAVRRARTASDKRNGKRWVVQAEFPGGRKIKLDHTRNKPPAVTKLRQTVRAAVQAVVTATGGGSAEQGGGAGGGGGGGNVRYPNVSLE